MSSPDVHVVKVPEPCEGGVCWNESKGNTIFPHFCDKHRFVRIKKSPIPEDTDER